MIPLDPNYGAKKRYYFAYGSNTDEKTLLRRLKNAHVKGGCLSSPSLDLTKIGNASLHGYGLGFAGDSETWDGPAATITRDPTRSVSGVLYLTDKSQEDTLSCFENADAHHPDGFFTYRKYKVLVDCDDGNTYDAYTFVLSPLMGPAKEQPKQKYLDILDAGQEQMKTEELARKYIRMLLELDFGKKFKPDKLQDEDGIERHATGEGETLELDTKEEEAVYRTIWHFLMGGSGERQDDFGKVDGGNMDLILQAMDDPRYNDVFARYPAEGFTGPFPVRGSMMTPAKLDKVLPQWRTMVHDFRKEDPESLGFDQKDVQRGYDVENEEPYNWGDENAYWSPVIDTKYTYISQATGGMSHWSRSKSVAREFALGDYGGKKIEEEMIPVLLYANRNKSANDLLDVVRLYQYNPFNRLSGEQEIVGFGPIEVVGIQIYLPNYADIGDKIHGTREDMKEVRKYIRALLNEGEGIQCPIRGAWYGGMPAGGGFSSHKEYTVGAQRYGEAAHCILGSLGRRVGAHGESEWHSMVAGEKEHLLEEIGIMQRSISTYSDDLYIKQFNDLSQYREEYREETEEYNEGAIVNIKKMAPKLEAKATSALKQLISVKESEPEFPESVYKVGLYTYQCLGLFAKAMLKSVEGWDENKQLDPRLNAFKDTKVATRTGLLEQAINDMIRELGPA